jgi:uncharacterized protein YcbK (DUF882 family)
MQIAMAPAMPTVPGMMAEVAAGQGTSNTSADTPTQATPMQATAEANPTGPASAADTAPAQDGGAPAMTAAAVEAGDDIPLPEVVAYVPTPNPENPFAVVMPGLDSGSAAAAEALPAVALIPEPNPVASGQFPVPVDIPAGADAPPQATAYAGATPAPAPHKPRGFFASLFAPSSDHNIVSKASAHEQPQIVASLDQTDTKPLIDARAPAKPVVDMHSDDEASTTAQDSDGNPLPGVRSGNSLFEITRKSGTGDNSDVDINEEGAEPVQVASAAGMARLDPHGLLLQRDTVDTACLRPPLLAVLKKIEQHYGRKLVVTSGYRSRVHNAAARGARNSLHMFCAAADVQMPGVSKWELAAYARSMPGRGGVGTYCYTKSVHIDIGPERDWNWRCRRKRHRR